LALQKGAVLRKDAFLNHLYCGIDQSEPKIINVFTCKLRRKFIENGAECRIIDTVWRKGCTLRGMRDYQALEKAS
jgi:two-component system, cell cycle response regulator CtrA